MELHINELKKNKNSERIYVIPEVIIRDINEHALAKTLYFTDIGCFENAKHHHRERVNGCEQAILIYCFKGTGYYITNGQKKIVEKDTLLFIPENTPHVYASTEEEPWSILWIHVKGSNLGTYYSYKEHTISTIHVPLEKQSKIKNQFEDIFEVLEQGFHFESLLYSYQILAHILGLFFLSSNYNKLSMKDSGMSISESIDYMIKLIDSNLTLDELAKHSKLSPAHYSFLFKKHTGYSPINYFLRLKIQRACVYLDTSDCPINEVAEQLGFKDPFYFSRLFHNIMGMSPSEYRKKQKG